MFDPSTATWYLRSMANAGNADNGSFQYGSPGWTPIVGDWTGSGKTGIGVVDPKTSHWYLRQEASQGAVDAGSFSYGAPGWIPVVGDWTGSGHEGIGMFDPTTATWYLRNSVMPGAANFRFQYGAPGWIPVTGQWTGGPQTGIGVVNTFSSTWYLRNEHSAGGFDAGTFQFGGGSWKPVTGDWNGDGMTTPGTVDFTSGRWYIRDTLTKGPPTVFGYGLGAWTPLSGVWNASSGPFVTTPISATTVSAQSTTTLDLAGNFSDPNISNSMVQFDTSEGKFNVELLDTQTPRTVANFLNYVNSGAYNNSIFHRNAKDPTTGAPFVIQGGLATFQSTPTPNLVNITTGPTLANEGDAVHNTRGTIAMAKTSSRDSATSQFFFNLGDNSAVLDTTAQTSGPFTVFGQLVGTSDQAVVDALSGPNYVTPNPAPAAPYNEIGLKNYTGSASTFPGDTTAANYALINNITVRQTEKLTYSVTNNSNPSVASATFVTNFPNRLTLTGLQTGTTTLTIRATNKEGKFVDTSFNVTVP
jgi:cyclophilin family peptidyl-prolyl cis-trans isomerase